MESGPNGVIEDRSSVPIVTGELAPGEITLDVKECVVVDGACVARQIDRPTTPGDGAVVGEGCSAQSLGCEAVDGESDAVVDGEVAGECATTPGARASEQERSAAGQCAAGLVVSASYRRCSIDSSCAATDV